MWLLFLKTGQLAHKNDKFSIQLKS
jgi:hypothetical protein